MADRYLLESGAPDGYLLEDGSGVALLEGFTSPIDDGEAWWAGAQRCFVQVAIAGAAALLSANVAIAQEFNKNEDVTPKLTAASGEGGAKTPNMRATIAPTFVRWGQGDDIVPQGATVPLDMEGWQPESKAPPPVLRLWTEPDELPTPPAPAAPDEHYTWAPQWVPSQVVTLLQVDSDFAVAVAPFGLDEEAWPAPPVRIVPPLFKVWQEDDQRPTPAAFSPVEEDAPQLGAFLVGANGIIWATDEEILPQGVFVDSPGGATAALPVMRARIEPRFQRWGQAEEVPTPAAPIALDDDVWQIGGASARIVVPTLWVVADELPVQPLAAGLSAEIDAAFALAPVQILPAGVSSETDLAVALAALQVLPTGRASEQDAALSLAALQSQAAGRADELDEALALLPGGALAVGMAQESDQAFALDGIAANPALTQTFSGGGGQAFPDRVQKPAKAKTLFKGAERRGIEPVRMQVGMASTTEQAFALDLLIRHNGLLRSQRVPQLLRST